jgi:GntR family transcriptional regulator, transcriptional repressor for pyruvate dehydrogenase complex
MASHGLPIASTGAVVSQLKTSEAVARRIVGDIVDGGLRPGDHLAGEAVMVQRYGVSRESFREGLRLLEAQGMLTLKRGPGGGPVIHCVDPANLGRISTLYFHLAGGTYRELIEAWIMAEGTLAERAACHADAAHRRLVMAPYLSPAGAPVTDQPEFVSGHAAFHGAVATLADNSVLQIWLQTMGLIISRHVVDLANLTSLHALIADDHHQIAAAVTDGDPELAKQLMEEHVASIGQHLDGELLGSLDDHIQWK